MESRDGPRNRGGQGQGKQKLGQGRSKSNFVRNDGLAMEGGDIRQEQRRWRRKPGTWAPVADPGKGRLRGC